MKDVSCSVKFWRTPRDIDTGTGTVGLCWVHRRRRNACGEVAKGEVKVRWEKERGARVGGRREGEGSGRGEKGA